MDMNSKLTLSADEQQLVTNTEWILTKRKIIEKTVSLLGAAAEQQQAVVKNEKNWLPAAATSTAPKIARGENYLGLPYLLLDHPRCFEGENIFAIRTMFWWGNFFSVTLHLSGSYKNMFQQSVAGNLAEADNDIFVCINENQWQHHFEADNYRRIHTLQKGELQKLWEQRPFIKLAVQFPLQAWNEIPSLLDTAFSGMITLLKT